MVRMDNNLLTYVLTMPNLDTTGHWWVGALALLQFELEYQKGADNGAADALSRVPISHSWETIQSLLEGAIVGVTNQDEVRASKELLEEHEHLSQEMRVQAAKLAPMHIVGWEEVQEADAALVLCCSNVVQVLLSLNPFQLNLEFGTTHRVQMCYTSKQV